MHPKPVVNDGNGDLLCSRLEVMINPRHELVNLVKDARPLGKRRHWGSFGEKGIMSKRRRGGWPCSGGSFSPVVCFNHKLPALDSVYDAVGISGPDEGLWVLVGLGDEAFDSGLEIDDRMERATL